MRVQRRMPLEQALPDHGDHRGRDQDLRKARQLLLLDFAARDRKLDQRAHAGEAARDHFAVVEIGDRGKPRPLGHDQAHDVAAPRRRDLWMKASANPSSASRTDPLRPAAAMQAADQRHDRGADQLLEHRFLVLEVQVDRALGDAGALRDVVEPRRGKAARDELLHRRLDDRRAPLRRALGAVRGRGRGSLAPARPRAGLAGLVDFDAFAMLIYD